MGDSNDLSQRERERRKEGGGRKGGEKGGALITPLPSTVTDNTFFVNPSDAL